MRFTKKKIFLMIKNLNESSKLKVLKCAVRKDL